MYFDYFTLILYLIMGLVGCLYVNETNRVEGEGRAYVDKNIYTYAFVFIFVIFAVSRKIAYNIGGADADAYKDMFLYSLSGNGRYEEQEQLFGDFNKFIRLFTNNYKVYFLICYGFIAFSYSYFIRKLSPKNISCIPFILLVFPYLKSFCTLRSSIAIAVFLIGVVFLKQKKFFIASVLIILTFFVHRMSILYILYLPFYFLYRNKVKDITGIRLVIFLFGYIFLGYIIATYIQKYVIMYQLFSAGTDSWYLTRSLETGFMSRWPMLFPHIILLCFLFFFDKKIEYDEDSNYIKLLCLFDVIVMPVSVLLGFWRANEYLYVARLIMWGFLISLFLKKFTVYSKNIIRVCAFLVFLFWLIFRIYSEWEDLKIMPYIFDLF